MKKSLNLLFYFLKKDIKSRYAGSGFGIAWTVLLPVFQIILFWLVFSTIIKARPYANTPMPYSYFLLSSFFFWLAFSESLLRTSNSIIENAEIIKKIPFPNILLPVTVTISSYLLNMVGFVLFIITYSFLTSFSFMFVFIIPVIFLQFLFSLGLGIFLSALLPYVRDIGQLLAYIVQGLFFLSPIIYSIEAIPKKILFIFYCNPLTYFVTSYHKIILFKETPSLSFLAVIVLLSTGSLIGGLYVFKKLREGFADVL
jgi:ABC-type polysaccharide/polyol phosphate export permease